MAVLRRPLVRGIVEAASLLVGLDLVAVGLAVFAAGFLAVLIAFFGACSNAGATGVGSGSGLGAVFASGLAFALGDGAGSISVSSEAEALPALGDFIRRP